MSGPAQSALAGLSPVLMDRLSAMQIVAPKARAARGVGERQSRTSGPGMEFAEYRAYRAGDDLRHVDPRSLALGAPLTRTYVQRRQLQVQIVLDLTASMVAAPEKAELAMSLASALGFVALVGQDRVQVTIVADKGELRTSPNWQGRSRAPELFAFCRDKLKPVDERERSTPQTPSDTLAEALRDLTSKADAGTVIVVLSDFWDQSAIAALGTLANAPASLIGLQILSAIERDPSAYGEGVHRLADAETGQERDIAIDATLLSKYRQAVEMHQQTLRDALGAHNVFLSLPAEQNLHELCFEVLPQAGVIA